MSGRALRLLAAAAILVPLGACGDAKDTPPPSTKSDAAAYAADGRIDQKPTSTPNVLVVVLSGVRYDLATGRPGEPSAMPHFESFARSAASFTDTASPAAWTAPAFASLLTGGMPAYAHNVTGVPGERGDELIDRMVLLPEVFQAAGYATAAFTEGGAIAARRKFAQGFDSYAEDFRLEDGVPRVRAWLDARPKDRPVFVLVHADDAAEPFAPKSHPAGGSSALRASVDQSLARTAATDGVVDPGDVPTFLRALCLDPVASARIAKEVLPTRLAEAAAIAGSGSVLRGERGDVLEKEVRARYVENLRRVDALLGTLLTEFDGAKLSGESVVVVCSDHGVALGEARRVPRRFGSGGSLFEEHVHVPLAIRAPGKLPSRAVPGSCSLLDLFPTLVDVLGLPKPNDTVGHSLLPLGRQESGPGLPTYGLEFAYTADADGKIARRRLMSARSARAKLLFTFEGASRAWSEQLFDRIADPLESAPLDASGAGSFGGDFEAGVRQVRELLAGRRAHLKSIGEIGYATSDG